MKKIGRKKFKVKVCHFCAERIDLPGYKDVTILHRFITDRGKIISSRSSGNCAYHQRKLKQAIKQARHLALLPFATI